MGRKFEELMRNYGKVKQFPMDAPLMPLAENPQSSPEPLNEQALQTVFERMNKAKQEGPKESEHWRFKVPQKSPKS
jgi:hypothetical protein